MCRYLNGYEMILDEMKCLYNRLSFYFSDLLSKDQAYFLGSDKSMHALPYVVIMIPPKCKGPSSVHYIM